MTELIMIIEPLISLGADNNRIINFITQKK